MVVSNPLRPNATVLNQWSTGSHTNVDEEVTQPDGGNLDYWMGTDVGGDDNQVIVMGFPDTINDVDEVTNITVWSNGNKTGGNPEIDIDMGGLQGYVECVLVNSPAIGWTSNSFDGNWTQADLDGLEVRYRADVPNKNDQNKLDVVYVIVTYSQAAVGYGHDFMGVPAANIDEVNGIPTANIDTIKGV